MIKALLGSIYPHWPHWAKEGVPNPTPNGRSTRRLVALVAVLSLLSLLGCAHDHLVIEQSIERMGNDINELRMERDRLQNRIMELNDKLVLMEDRLDSTRLAVQSRGKRQGLPVIRLEPQGGSFSHIGSSSPSESPVQKQHDEDVPVIRAKGNSQQHPKDKWSEADRRGIVVEERLSIAPIPPAPTPSGARKRTASHDTPAANNREAGASNAAVQVPDLPDNPVRAYRMAFETLREGNIDNAQTMFLGFAQRWPRHDLSDNAWYWIAECHYAKHEFEDAIKYFRKVIEEYPDGNKVPDALLKVGLSYHSLGETETARKVIEQLLEIFPEGDVAQVARERLEGMQ